MTTPAVPGQPAVRDLLASLIRTAVPTVVGWALAWLLSRGFDLTAYTNAINAYLVPACIVGYYALVRLAEARYPAAGWLLGYAARPKYIDQTGQPVAPPAGPVTFTSSLTAAPGTTTTGTRLYPPAGGYNGGPPPGPPGHPTVPGHNPVG